MNDLKFDTVEVAEASKIAPLTAYTFLGGEFGHKVEVVSELGQNDWQTKEMLQEIARRWNAHQELLEALRALLEASPGPDKGYVSTPYFEARQSARAAIAKATKP
jgi:hypothetical protein